MKQKIMLKNLCCANCARMIEEGVKKTDGVKDAKLNFLMKKLTIDINEENSDCIFKEIHRIVKDIEPDIDLEIK